MAGPHDSDEATLHTQLAEATDAQTRGRIHGALAVCAGRALAYRRMNHHEEASAWAYAEDSPRLAAAMQGYRAAIDAFGARRDAEGLEGVRAARPVIVEELGALHPYAQQVTNTLAGRLGGAATLAERVALRRWLVAGREALFGRTHTCTLQHLGDLAYLLAAADDREGAMAAFEEAIDGLLLGPWPHEAARLLDRLGDLCREVGTPERTRLRERRLLAASPSSEPYVRDVFFRRVVRTRSDPSCGSSRRVMGGQAQGACDHGNVGRRSRIWRSTAYARNSRGSMPARSAVSSTV